jgi:hypothetical protein
MSKALLLPPLLLLPDYDQSLLSACIDSQQAYVRPSPDLVIAPNAAPTTPRRLHGRMDMCAAYRAGSGHGDA